MAESNLLAFYLRNQPEIDEVMMPFMASFAAVGLRQLNSVILDPVDRADVNPVRTNDFHVLFYI